MTTTPHEEPQQERGAPGSRDAGSNQPEGGPAERPGGTSHEQSDTSVAPQDSGDDAPNLQTP